MMLFKYPLGKRLTDEQIARLAIEAELDAINLYEQLSTLTNNRVIKGNPS